MRFVGKESDQVKTHKSSEVRKKHVDSLSDTCSTGYVGCL